MSFLSSSTCVIICDNSAVIFFCQLFQLNMEKKLLKRIEGMEHNEREKLREMLKDSNKPFVYFLTIASLYCQII